ncbi:MAG TPA: GNAT family N-acetyltransferase [Ktedonobacterales bacterium]|nr:GNAT family N-acetyltransferase [Ktedonobacterales bacterium]
MQLQRFDDIEAFAARAEPYLVAHEATHCLMLGLLSTLPSSPMPGDKTPYMTLVEQDNAIVLVAMRTPPFPLILSLIAPELATGPAEALALVVLDVRTHYGDGMPSVIGPVPISLRFAELWRQQTGRIPRQAISERIYALETVNPPADVPGSCRRVTAADRELMVRWLAAFAAEALGSNERLDAAEWVDSFYATPSRDGYLWEDGGAPVSLVAYGNPTAHGVRIGPVYTPLEHRGRGYASACVAAVSQRLLESGRTFCFLFTDLANPTSNHIYQAVGYYPVNDVDVYEFDTEK